METLVGAEGNGEGKFKESRIHKTNSTFSSPNLGADPVVYKLVRVYFIYAWNCNFLIGQ